MCVYEYVCMYVYMYVFMHDCVSLSWHSFVCVFQQFPFLHVTDCNDSINTILLFNFK